MRTSDDMRAVLLSVFTYIDRLYLPEPADEAKRPWRAIALGVEWAISTQGHFLVAVRRELVAGECFDAPGKIGAAPAKWWAIPPVTSTVVSAGDLRRWAGHPYSAASCRQCNGTQQTKCSRCGGSGHDSHVCSVCDTEHVDGACPDCEQGIAICSACASKREAREGLLLNIPVNRLLLAKALDVPAPSDTEQLRVSVVPLSQRDGDCFMIEPVTNDPQWRANLMALRYHNTKVRFEAPETWEAA